mmetsp:Transcript_42077/g.51026  ORF Transcript_42077/g.51026 Transcript_42077/m.51026 type:complete len:459 (-) Transcript_42077:215-1591(-)|eukprot:CAMPEP_0197860808 /NCGR_PEP_ID=MMETSP1438-20131217/36434_1 /TAXON_ID=1461541 /ORGANISM="Pterosperma sp., Strain CCMP1384" /LENGTH=458 /DNA_ID=CAMNT_0043477793 /DNA_START=149 /DNA_END=1525 /DNA_ORIENTATION=+
MSGKEKKKLAPKGDVEDLAMTPNERILKNITELYSSGLSSGDVKVGLKNIADDPLVGVRCNTPRKKVSCMIIGNHSAGKSSFLNWYIDETIQRTGVAIETRGFSFLTSGRKRETLKGDATLAYFDHLAEIKKFEGINENVFTEVSTSKEKNFTCVDFIDSPGLVDGDMQYPFDVSSCIVWLADYVDIILVFFDPIGQALCKRTVQVIKRLNESHAEKMQYYMTKADQVETETDRQRVLIQITQNLHPHIKNSHAFSLPTIYLPNEESSAMGIPNSIEEVCEDIDKAIRMTVQKNLSALKTDCGSILEALDKRMAQDTTDKAANFKKRIYGTLLTLTGWTVLLFVLLLILCQVAESKVVQTALTAVAKQLKNPELAGQITGWLSWMKIEDTQLLYYCVGGLIFMYLVILVIGKVMWRLTPVLTKKELSKIQDYRKYVKGIGKIRDQMYADYFKQLNNDA